MRTVIRWISLGVVVVVLLLWLLKGPNLGWTKTSVAVEKIEEVTGITYRVLEDRFVPGVDFLLAGLGAGALLFGLSFLFRKELAP